MQKAVTFCNVTAFLYVVGDRRFEPKKPPSGPTFYQTMEMRYQTALITENYYSHFRIKGQKCKRP